MKDQADNLRKMINNQNEIDDRIIFHNQYVSKVIAVSSGKGGVGKSNFVVNLAYNFSLLGKKVVIIDADLGLANIEVLFGIIPDKNLSHILYEDLPINEALTDGPNGIKFLSGGSGIVELSKASNKEQQRLIECFNYLDNIFDIIIIDTGAGVSGTVINFNKAATTSIVVTTPEPTSITDAYALIKIMKNEHTIENGDFEISLVVNKINETSEGKYVFEKLDSVCKKFLDVDLTFLGHLSEDSSLINAVKKQNPVSILYPDSKYSKDIKSIAHKLLHIKEKEEPKQKKENSYKNLTFASKLLRLFGRN